MPIVSADDFEFGSWKPQFRFGASHWCEDQLLYEFINKLSSAISINKAARDFPDLMTFAFATRKSQLSRYISLFSSQERRRGWGSVVHITPGNIPVNFAFSFLMGFLSGNSNIVRLPTKEFDQIKIFVSCFDEVASSTEYHCFRSQNLFVRTEMQSVVLDETIAQSQGLVVWGSDRTIEHFRKKPKSPGCADFYFPSRVSSLLIDARQILELDDDALRKVAKLFFNDTFVVDQNACSSPNMIFWHGSESDIAAAKKYFWKIVSELVNADYNLGVTASVDKMLDVMNIVKQEDAPIAISKQAGEKILHFTDADVRNHVLRYGAFVEVSIANISEVRNYLRKNEQTLTVFGLSTEAVFNEMMYSQKHYGQPLNLDRIVPLGTALDMQPVWDGKNMLNSLSRVISIF